MRPRPPRDPFRGYQRALHAGLPDTVVVVDAFHAVRLAQGAIDDVRRRVQQDTTGHRGRKNDPPDADYRVLLRGAEHLTERRSYARLLTGYTPGTPTGRWPRRGSPARNCVTSTPTTPTGPAAASSALLGLRRHRRRRAAPPRARHRRLGKPAAGLLHHRRGLKWPHTEAVNLLIKRIKRVGFGFRNFANYRLRLLLHCGADRACLVGVRASWLVMSILVSCRFSQSGIPDSHTDPCTGSGAYPGDRHGPYGRSESGIGDQERRTPAGAPAPLLRGPGCQCHRVPRSAQSAILSMFEESTMDGPVSIGWPPRQVQQSQWTAR
jgi:hypothetical protein